jgi:hypothetical protein
MESIRSRSRTALGAAGLAVLLCLGSGGSPLAKSEAEFELERHAVAIGHYDDSALGYRLSGAGIYLGAGKFLTASHLVRPIEIEGPVIVFDHKPLTSRVVKRGAYEDVDVTLLTVDQYLLPKELRKLSEIKLCPDDPIPGETVTVVAPGNVTNSIIVPSSVLGPQLATKLPTLIRDVYTTGNSGAGVFDPDLGCLMGIMSRKIERSYWQEVNGVRTEMKEGIAKYFVSTKMIRAFLGPYL